MIKRLIAATLSFVLAFTVIFSTVYEAPAEEAENIKNVIIMIGDGMGYNHLYATEKEHNVKLQMLERTNYHGYSRTHSAVDFVTDSAAGATALSTGVRTQNGCLSVYLLDQNAIVDHPTSITEVAMKYGKSTGIVTSDSLTGATPGGFSVHVKNRSMGEEIAAQQLASDIDLLWGSASGEFTQTAVEEAGFEYCTTLSSVQSLEDGQKSIGQFDSTTMWQGLDNGDNPTLSELTEEAINVLSKDEDGFFLMVEGAHIDKQSHGQNGPGAMQAVLEFDKAIGNAIDFAEADGETLVIITADHETGSVKLRNDVYTWTSGSHSAAWVPVLVYGADSFIEDGESLMNKEIPMRAVAYMTNNEQYFPIRYSEFIK